MRLEERAKVFVLLLMCQIRKNEKLKDQVEEEDHENNRAMKKRKKQQDMLDRNLLGIEIELEGRAALPERRGEEFLLLGGGGGGGECKAA